MDGKTVTLPNRVVNTSTARAMTNNDGSFRIARVPPPEPKSVEEELEELMRENPPEPKTPEDEEIEALEAEIGDDYDPAADPEMASLCGCAEATAGPSLLSLALLSVHVADPTPAVRRVHPLYSHDNSRLPPTINGVATRNTVSASNNCEREISHHRDFHPTSHSSFSDLG